MERTVGDKFKYKDIILEIKNGNSCDGCFFYDEYCCEDKVRNVIGDCSDKLRMDNVPIIFIKA